MRRFSNLQAGAVAPFAKGAVCAAILALASLPGVASAQPVELKLSFFAAENTKTFDSGIKPFVDAVNAEGKGLVAITVYASGALGKAVAEQPGMVTEGVADIAWVVPGQTPYRFPDNQLLELPGLFRDAREGTLTYTRLIAVDALRGYQDFVVIGAYMSGPTIIHSRKPIASLAALEGQKLRANNQVEAGALEQLGALPTVLPISQMANAMARGSIDGAALSPTALFDFGVAPLAKNHYLLRGGATPLVLLMNRKKFESLPDAAKTLIRKYSGEHAAAAWIDSFGASERDMLAKIKADPERKVVEPSPPDRDAAQRKYQALIEAWAAKSPRNSDLVKTIEAHLVTIRSTQ